MLPAPRGRRSVPLVTVLVTLCCLFAMASSSAARTYSVGVEDVDYFPIYSVAPPDYQFRGYARDLLDMFAAHEGIHLHFVSLPVRRLARQYSEGRLDLVFPDNPRWRKAEKSAEPISYSQPVLQFQDAMLVLPARLGQPRASFHKLGFVRGFTPWKFQAEIASGQVEIHESPNPQGLIHMTLAGYIDGANMAQQVAHYHLVKLGQPAGLVVELGLLPRSDSYYYLSSMQHPELIQRFDAFLHSEQVAISVLKQQYGL